jgi:hypothetical protein
MKYLLLLLALAGCAHTEPPPANPVEDSKPPVVLIALGTDGFIDWRCELTELNDKLVWIPCKFHNRNPATTTGACIRVSFYDERTGKLVVQSRKVCSGILKPDDISENYAAFIKENRATLQRCGEVLDLCVMLAGAEKQ